MKTMGSGVIEIRLRDESGAYRIIYTAKIQNKIYVLHAFQKQTQKTTKQDIELAKKRLSELQQR